ncbi:hypothetical protein [Nostoc sp. 'Peltigera membranacea cyanobiont' 210A]|uniref:hypothetical protein n=1 Tax=Nostoc sp. 'Peltigera membranacea cyanobiont' 210A TaxID=2014529 RepID=UPI00167F09B5|nr:hypothetical protein [Nostoc sp. 'Peltigera membranacea cyanobiont' 210A]
MQAASPLYETLREHRGRVILTSLATVPGYQWVFCFDVRGSHQDEQQVQQSN